MDKILSASLKTGENVQLGEALSAGLKVTVVGLSIVFAVLIVLMIVLMLGCLVMNIYLNIFILL